LFHPEATVELGIIRTCIDQMCPVDLLDVVEVVFSSIIVRCSRQESDTRWCAVDKPFARGDALRLMNSRLKAALVAVTEFGRTAPKRSFHRREMCRLSTTCTHTDGRHRLGRDVPALPNSFDYYLYHKLRMFWLGLDHTKPKSGRSVLAINIATTGTDPRFSTRPWASALRR